MFPTPVLCQVISLSFYKFQNTTKLISHFQEQLNNHSHVHPKIQKQFFHRFNMKWITIRSRRRNKLIQKITFFSVRDIRSLSHRQIFAWRAEKRYARRQSIALWEIAVIEHRCSDITRPRRCSRGCVYNAGLIYDARPISAIIHFSMSRASHLSVDEIETSFARALQRHKPAFNLYILWRQNISLTRQFLRLRVQCNQCDGPYIKSRVCLF